MSRVLDIIELEDLLDEITHRVTEANRNGTLEEILTALGMEDLIEQETFFESYKDGKIVVIGGGELKEDQLKMIAGKLGIDKRRIECCLDYEAAQKYNYNKLQYNSSYRVVLFGAVPHSSTGKGDSSSVVAEMEAHPSIYPRVARLTSNSALKITKSNFKEALANLLDEGYIA